jgi:hypothetical protein
MIKWTNSLTFWPCLLYELLFYVKRKKILVTFQNILSVLCKKITTLSYFEIDNVSFTPEIFSNNNGCGLSRSLFPHYLTKIEQR